ncbi:undecaprenyl diphosphate synthase family protein [Halosimplex amylolyticum]|uniref:undecaprenyl diphosphate synthase family protein n=1 Tax=Halosimplex amylolyticum TaxID=3396616 RepID=UPI003F553785
MGLYEWYLTLRLRNSDADLPETVAVIVTERDLLEADAYLTLERFFEWAVEFGVDRIAVYVSVLDAEVVDTIREELADVRAPRELAVRGPEDEEQADAPIVVSIGLGGKHEFATAVQALAEEVEAGELAPEDIDETAIERELVFPVQPDLVIKTGAERLSDFMIWQSVYSELYFTDVNWRDFRRRDYLRALRDYQNRQRRFGR